MTIKKTMQLPRIGGFSLVEMMIAMTIGLMIVGALMAVIVSSSKTTKTNDRSSELQTNGRYALDMIKRDIQVAGYFGLTGSGFLTPTTLPAAGGAAVIALPNDCYKNFATNLSQRVWGSNDGTNTFAAKCIPAGSYAGSDILVLRYASLDSAPSKANLATANYNTAGGLYFRSAYEQAVMYQVPNYPTITNTPQEDHRVEVHIYYINPNTSAAIVDGIPSLHRVIFDATGAMVDELVASGIQNLQVQYGVKNGPATAQNTQFFDAQNVNPAAAPATDSVTAALDLTGNSAPPNGTPWGDVKAVRVWLLARNVAPDKQGYTNTNTYAMGDQNLAAANDGYRRQLFTSTIQLRN